MDSSAYIHPPPPPRSLHVIQENLRADLSVDELVFFTYLCCFFYHNYIIMPRNVIDYTYLEILVNLVEEHLALYDTSSKEYAYKDSIQNGYSRSYGCGTFIFR